MKYVNTLSITLVCLVMGIAVAWQYKSVYNNTKTAAVQSMTLEDLKDRLISEKKKNDDLRERKQAIDEDLAEFEAAKGNKELYEKNIRSEVEQSNILAGLVDVSGPGIKITLSVEGTDFVLIRATYILKIVNALRAVGANAVAVNDERIIAMSEIFELGDKVLINGIAMNSNEPFVVKAIIETQKQDESIKTLGSIFADIENDNLTSVEVEKLESLVIPKIEKNRSSFDFGYIRTQYMQSYIGVNVLFLTLINILH